jgi:hypothetical protein
MCRVMTRTIAASVREDAAVAGYRGDKVMTTVRGDLQAIETRIGTLQFTHDFANGYPTVETVDKLYDERDL